MPRHDLVRAQKEEMTRFGQKKLGVDLVRFNGDHLWRLLGPARFVIDRNGNVRAVDADPDYTKDERLDN
jgi:hypothetical protein